MYTTYAATPELARAQADAHLHEADERRRGVRLARRYRQARRAGMSVQDARTAQTDLF